MSAIEILTLCERALWASAALVPLGIGLWRAIREGRGPRRPEIKMFVATEKNARRRFASAA